MALEVGSVYLSTYLDGDGIEKGLGSIKEAANTTLTSVGGLMQKAFNVAPTFDLTQMSAAMDSSVAEASKLIEPTIGRMGDVISSKSAEAVNSLGTITSFISGGFTKQWTGSWNAVGEGFKGTWKGVGNFFSGIINGVVGGINGVLSGLNKVNINMPAWLGGGSFSFNLPTIANLPFLASGGVINRPTMAMIGEAGKEAVMPLERNTGWITDLADSIGSVVAARMAMGGGGGYGASSGGVVNLYIDGQKFASATIEDFERAALRRDNKMSLLKA